MPRKPAKKPQAVDRKKVTSKTDQKLAPSLTRGKYVLYVEGDGRFLNVDGDYSESIFGARQFENKNEAKKERDRLELGVLHGYGDGHVISMLTVAPLSDFADTIYAFDEDGYMVMEIAEKGSAHDPLDKDYRKARAKARDRHLLVIADQKEKLKQVIREMEKIRREALADIHDSEKRLKKFERNAKAHGKL